MPSLKDVYCKLTKLHEALDHINKGDHPYRQFYTFRSINGDTCKLLTPLAFKVPLDAFEKDLDELARTYTDYKLQQQQPPFSSPQ
jgi:hypothetical protein